MTPILFWVLILVGILVNNHLLIRRLKRSLKQHRERTTRRIVGDMPELIELFQCTPDVYEEVYGDYKDSLDIVENEIDAQVRSGIVESALIEIALESPNRSKPSRA